MGAATYSTTDLAKQLGQALQEKGWLLATAESCTGGLLSAYLTDISGSSAWFSCGFVTYSNHAKMTLLNVAEETLTLYGAVSEETAKEMALGALEKSAANVSVSITGIAGPSGGSAEKPVGMVCFAWATKNCQHLPTLASVSTHFFTGNRQQVREQAVYFAMHGLIQRVSQSNG